MGSEMCIRDRKQPQHAQAKPQHSPNAWGDLLSRWVSVVALPVRAVAVFGPCDQDDSMPSKAVVRQSQQKALATDGTEVQSFKSAVGIVVLDDEGRFRIHALGLIPVTFTPRRATPLASAFSTFTGISSLCPFL